KEPQMPAVSVVPKPAEAQEKRGDAIRLIALYFADGSYSNGYSDKRVADETGISIEYVRKFREDNFGAFKMSPEFTGLRNEIAELKQAIRQCQGTLATLQSQATALDAKADAIVKANGFKV